MEASREIPITQRELVMAKKQKERNKYKPRRKKDKRSEIEKLLDSKNTRDLKDPTEALKELGIGLA